MDRSESMKVEIKESELLLGVDLSFILMNSRKKKERRILEIFSSQGRSEFLVGQQSAMGRVAKDAGDTGQKVKKLGTRCGLWS